MCINVINQSTWKTWWPILMDLTLLNFFHNVYKIFLLFKNWIELIPHPKRLWHKRTRAQNTSKKQWTNLICSTYEFREILDRIIYIGAWFRFTLNFENWKWRRWQWRHATVVIVVLVGNCCVIGHPDAGCNLRQNILCLKSLTNTLARLSKAAIYRLLVVLTVALSYPTKPYISHTLPLSTVTKVPSSSNVLRSSIVLSFSHVYSHLYWIGETRLCWAVQLDSAWLLSTYQCWIQHWPKEHLDSL